MTNALSAVSAVSVGLGIGLMAVALNVSAQQSLPLTDDLSRGELFQIMLDRVAQSPDLSPVEKSQFAFPLAFTFPHDAKFRDPLLDLDPRSNQIFGVDVSHHNAENCRCDIDWQLLRSQEVRYAYFKVSQGARYVDELYPIYRKGVLAVPAAQRIPTGAYHFLSSEGTPESQAANFIAHMGALTAEDLPPVVDLEWDVRVVDHKAVLYDSGPFKGKPRDFWDVVPADEILTRVITYAKAVEKSTGRAPLVYTNPVWWSERIGDPKKIAALGKYGVWTSDYSKSGRKLEKPGVPNNASWTIWQFTSSARMNEGGIGTGQYVDANVFNGTEAEFRAAMGLRP